MEHGQQQYLLFYSNNEPVDRSGNRTASVVFMHTHHACSLVVL